jgi:putative transposase
MAMPRLRRLDVPGLPQHLITRGNDRRDMFFSLGDRAFFLQYLDEARRDHGVHVHSYVLMDNHVHLLATGGASFALSRMMRDVGRRYVQHVNAIYGRTGTLFEGRFKSCLVETSSYFLTCMRYVEMNPVRAGMAANPAAFRWSSFKENASGTPSGMLTAHPEYLALGRSVEARRQAYLRLFEEGVDVEKLQAIRESTNMCRALGSPQFARALEATLKRRVSVVPQGRPSSRIQPVPFFDGKGT